MTDLQLLQQALDALEGLADYRYTKPVEATMKNLRERLAQCDRCGKKLGGEGDIHTCTPDPIGDAQDKLIAEMAAQPEQQPVAIDWDTKTDTPIMGYTTPPAAQPEQEPVAWLCGRSNGDTFALTVKQLRELGYGNISMPPFKKLAPLFTALAQQEMAHDRMMDDALTIGSAWVRDGKRLEPTSVYKSMEEDA